MSLILWFLINFLIGITLGCSAFLNGLKGAKIRHIALPLGGEEYYIEDVQKEVM